MIKLNEKGNEILKNIIKLMTLNFNKNWNLQMDEINNRYEFIILFKETTITNTKNITHNIKDLYMKLSLNVNNGTLKYYNLSGTRGYLTYKEYKSNYLHSHLNSNNSTTKFSTFCLGTSDANALSEKLIMEGLDDSDYITLDLFLGSLHTLASWESLEGVPYNYIEQLTLPVEQSSSSLPENQMILFVDKAIQFIKEDNSLLSITLNEVDSKVEVEISTAANIRLCKKLYEWHLEHEDIMVDDRYIESSNNNYIPFNNIRPIKSKPFYYKKDMFRFKNKPVHQYVEGYETKVISKEEEKDEVFYCNPQLINKLEKYFTKNINDKILNLMQYEKRKCAVKRIKAYRKSITPNYVPVFKD
jgi:hypothetical protein